MQEQRAQELRQLFESGKADPNMFHLLREWGKEIAQMTIDLSVLVECHLEEVKKGDMPGKSFFPFICYLVGHLGPRIAMSSARTLLYPLFKGIKNRFSADETSWIYYQMTEQIMKTLWEDPAKKEWIREAVYEESTDEELVEVPETDTADEEEEDDLEFSHIFTAIISEGWIESLLLGTDFKKKNT